MESRAWKSKLLTLSLFGSTWTILIKSSTNESTQVVSLVAHGKNKSLGVLGIGRNI